MAKKGFSLDFDGFLDLAREIGELGDDKLKQAVDNAFTASKDYINDQVEQAMNSSPYNFEAGKGYSKGRARASLSKVLKRPVEWSGTVARAYIGVDLHDALEVAFIINGTPHMAKDKKLYNAIKVKGKHKKIVEQIQQEEFQKVIRGALDG